MDEWTLKDGSINNKNKWMNNKKLMKELKIDLYKYWNMDEWTINK